MSEEQASSRGPGRPRDSRVDGLVLEAVAARLLAEGVDGVRMDELAAETGVAKSTIYRRWPSRAHLLVAVLRRGHQQIGTPQTGDIRVDLEAFTVRLAAALDPPGTRRLAAELAAAATQDRDLEAQVRRLWKDRRRELADVVDAAVERGDLRTDLPSSLVVDQLAGALYYHVFVTGEPLTPDFARHLVDSVLRGAMAGPHVATDAAEETIQEGRHRKARD